MDVITNIPIPQTDLVIDVPIIDSASKTSSEVRLASQGQSTCQSTKPINIWCLPSSGGGFSAQLGLLESIIKHTTCRPDVVLGTSGGSITAYIGLASCWNVQYIRRIVNRISSRLIFQCWEPAMSFIPAPLIGFNRGSLYKTSDQILPFFSGLFNNQTISQTEIWCGVFNETKGRGQLVVNGDTILDTNKINTRDFNLEPLHSTTNIDELARFCIASASIPGLVNAMPVNGSSYYDGGLVYSSPLTPMMDALLELPNCHITYFSCFNSFLPFKNRDSSANIVNNLLTAMHSLTRSMTAIEKQNAIRCLGNRRRECVYEELDFATFEDIENIRYRHRRSFLDLSASFDIAVDLTNFNSDDILRSMDQTQRYSFATLHTYY